MSSLFNSNGLPTLIHPLTHVVLQRILTVAAAFTPPSSNYRYAAAALLFLTTWSYLSTCHIYMENRTWKSIWGFLSTQFLAVYTERLLVSQWNWKDRGPRKYTRCAPLKSERPGEEDEEEVDVRTEAGSQLQGKGQVDDHRSDHVHGSHKSAITTVPQTKFAFAIALLFGTRGVNTPWQSKNTPPFSSKYSSRPPSRLQFLARRCLTVLLGFLIMDFGTSLHLDPKIFALDTVPFFARLSHVTLEETGTKMMNTLALWVINYAFICFFANCWAVFAVALGVSRPEAWPPGFGNVSDAWTLRMFWGWVSSLIPICPAHSVPLLRFD